VGSENPRCKLAKKNLPEKTSFVKEVRGVLVLGQGDWDAPKQSLHEKDTVSERTKFIPKKKAPPHKTLKRGAQRRRPENAGLY